MKLSKNIRKVLDLIQTRGDVTRVLSQPLSRDSDRCPLARAFHVKAEAWEGLRDNRKLEMKSKGLTPNLWNGFIDWFDANGTTTAIVRQYLKPSVLLKSNTTQKQKNLTLTK